MVEHKEEVDLKEISTSHVIHVKGGVKVLTYIPADKVKDILKQLKDRGGQISIFTANALGHSIANALAADAREIKHELESTTPIFNNPDYDIEESDDPRTEWKLGDD